MTKLIRQQRPEAKLLILNLYIKKGINIKYKTYIN